MVHECRTCVCDPAAEQKMNDPPQRPDRASRTVSEDGAPDRVPVAAPPSIFESSLRDEDDDGVADSTG